MKRVTLSVFHRASIPDVDTQFPFRTDVRYASYWSSVGVGAAASELDCQMRNMLSC